MSTSSLKIKLLLATALADGQFDTTELELLANRAMWWGITPEAFENIIDNPEITDAESEALPPEARPPAQVASGGRPVPPATSPRGRVGTKKKAGVKSE